MFRVSRKFKKYRKQNRNSRIHRTAYPHQNEKHNMKYDKIRFQYLDENK